jgi:hypothetical protein
MTDKITPDPLVRELTQPGAALREQHREWLEQLQGEKDGIDGAVYSLTSTKAYNQLNDLDRYHSIFQQISIIEGAIWQLDELLDYHIDELDKLDAPQS